MRASAPTEWEENEKVEGITNALASPSKEGKKKPRWSLDKEATAGYAKGRRVLA